jgi:4-hydroxy-tetrahydrodipicolinate synthase
MTEKLVSRRTFLATATATLGTATLGGAATNLIASSPALVATPTEDIRKPSHITSADEFKRVLVGPIQSQPTPITANLDVDYEGVRSVVSRGLRYGVKVFELTAGNSQYFALSYDEIKKITRALVEVVGDRGITIAATGAWWTERAVDYARYAESVGATALQVLLPTPSGDEDSIVRHFEGIAKATRLPLVLHGQYTNSLVKKLLPIETIVAMKEDATLDYYVDKMINFGDRLNIFGGGAENRYLVGYPYGAKSYFSTYTSFAPDISIKFWNAIQRGDIKGAAQFSAKYDYLFIERFSVPFWHATLEYFGVAGRYLRPPQIAFTEEQIKGVKQFFDEQGVYPNDYRE